MKKRFATQLTHLFLQPYTPESKQDMVCRLACIAGQASSASILMYAGKEDKLHCKGRYIDPDLSGLTYDGERKDGISAFDILKNICACEYLYSSREEIVPEKDEDLYQNYVEHVFTGREISREKFSEFAGSFDRWIKEYEKLKNALHRESYTIKKNPNSITGQWYNVLLNKGKIYFPEILIKNLNDVENQKKCTCIDYLKTELGLFLSDAVFYVALPLYATGRYFGVLRFLFPGETSFIEKKNDRWKLTDHHNEKLLDIARKISYHLEINYFMEGYKKTVLSSKKHTQKTNSLEYYFNTQCDSLSDIIKSRGAVVRRWDKNKRIYRIVGCSQKLKDYFESIKKKDQHFFEIIVKKFDQEQANLGVFFNCKKHPLAITKYVYYEDGGRLRYKHDTWELPELESSDVLAALEEMELLNIAVFPIPEVPKSFIIFFKSDKREFLKKDIAMVYPALRNLGLELKGYFYTRAIEEQMNTIRGMHKKVSDILNRPNLKSHEYVKGFLKAVSRTIHQFDFFPFHIQWEYVSEIIPDESSVDNMLRNITPKDFSRAPIDKNKNLERYKPPYYSLDSSGSESQTAISNYFDGNGLIRVLNLSLEEGYDYFDLPFFTEERSAHQSKKLVGVITFIYNIDDKYLIDSNDFFKFMHFFSGQLSLAWEKFRDSVAHKIQEKIDKEIRFEKKERIRTKKEELSRIAKVLAEEFAVGLCSFFLVNEQENILKLEASNLRIKQNIVYSFSNDPNILSVKSYKQDRNFRIFGRRRVEAFADSEKIKLLESEIKNEMLAKIKKDKRKIFKDILIEHWLVAVIKIGEKKLGVIKLYRVKGSNETDSQLRFQKITAPFSEYETRLLEHIQKHIFNIIVARHTIQQRMEDMRNVLHQVVAPLNALVGHSTNIIGGITPDEKVPEKLKYINILSRLAARYARNFQRILDIDTGNIKLNKELVINLKAYLIGIAIDYQALVQKKGIHIHVTGKTKESIPTRIDKDLFSHIIANLIDNAVKYSFYAEERSKHKLKEKPSSLEDKENVLIYAEETNNAVMITISNWGLSMTEDEKPNVFKREFRGSKAIDRAPIGTGIGLFLAREIVKLHDGSLELVPDNHENNTVFKIILPKGKSGGKDE